VSVEYRNRIELVGDSVEDGLPMVRRRSFE
jgi:hypothetical protein